MTTPTPLTLQAGAQLVTGPDNKLHIGVVLQSGVTQFTALLPADQATAFINRLADRVRIVVAQARRQNTGLIVAAPDQLAALRGNGGLPTQFKAPS